MIKLFSDGLMEKIHYRTNLNISGGAFQLKFKDIKRFVSELSQEFKIIPESNIQKFIQYLKQHPKEQLENKVEKAFEKATNVKLSYDQILIQLDNFRFMIQQVVQDNAEQFTTLKTKLTLLGQKLKQMYDLATDTELKIIIRELQNDFNYIMAMQEFITQKVLHYTREVPDKLEITQDQTKDSKVITLIVKLSNLLKNTSIKNEQQFRQSFEQLQKSTLSVKQPDQIKDIYKAIIDIVFSMRSDFVQLQEITVILQQIFYIIFREMDVTKKELIMKQINFIFTKMGDKKGGDRESSVKTRIINDTYEKDYKTKTFKTNINMYFTKIVLELYKLVEEKNLQSLKKHDLQIREIILVLMEIFEDLLDNNLQLYDIMEKLKESKYLEVSKIKVTSQIEKCINTLEDVKSQVEFQKLKEIIDNVIKILKSQKIYIQKIAGEIIEEIPITKQIIPINENEEILSDIVFEEMKNKPAFDFKSGGDDEQLMEQEYKHYYETNEMLEKLLNLLYSTQITRNLARARKELSQISDKRYYEKLTLPRLDAAQEKSDNYLKNMQDKLQNIETNPFRLELLRRWHLLRMINTKEQKLDPNEIPHIHIQIPKSLIDDIIVLAKTHRDTQNQIIPGQYTYKNLRVVFQENQKMIGDTGIGSANQKQIKKFYHLFGNYQAAMQNVDSATIFAEADTKDDEKKNNAASAQFKTLFNKMIQIKKQGHQNILRLAQTVEIFLDAQTKNIVEEKLKFDQIETLSDKLATESHVEIDKIINTSIDSNALKYITQNPISRDVQNYNKKEPGIFGGQLFDSHWENMNTIIDENISSLKKCKAFDHFSNLFYLICQNSIDNDKIMKLSKISLQKFMKSYILSSCFEMDPEELYQDNFVETEIPPELIDSVRPTDKFKVQCMKFMCGYWPSTNPNKDAKYIPSPAFIRFVDHDKSQYLPMIDSEKYCKINHLMDDTLPITSDFDNLYNQIIQAMTQKILNIIGMYRIYAKKRIDLQIPRLLFGGDSEGLIYEQDKSDKESFGGDKKEEYVFGQEEPIVLQDVALQDKSEDLNMTQFEIYYRIILLCEYYAQFFNKQTEESKNNQILFFIQPDSQSLIGKLLNYCFKIYKNSNSKSDNIQYTQYQLEYIIQLIKAIQAADSSNIFSQIVYYINTYCGILTHDEYQEINKTTSTSFKKDEGEFFKLEGDEYHEFEDLLEISRKQKQTDVNKNIQDDNIKHEQAAQLVSKQLEEMYLIIDNNQKIKQLQSIIKGIRSIKEQLKDKPYSKKITTLLSIINNKKYIGLATKKYLEIHETVKFPLLMLEVIDQKIKQYKKNEMQGIVLSPSELQDVDKYGIKQIDEWNQEMIYKTQFDNLLQFHDGNLVNITVQDDKDNIFHYNADNMIKMLNLFGDIISRTKDQEEMTKLNNIIQFFKQELPTNLKSFSQKQDLHLMTSAIINQFVYDYYDTSNNIYDFHSIYDEKRRDAYLQSQQQLPYKQKKQKEYDPYHEQQYQIDTSQNIHLPTKPKRRQQTPGFDEGELYVDPEEYISNRVEDFKQNNKIQQQKYALFNQKSRIFYKQYQAFETTNLFAHEIYTFNKILRDFVRNTMTVVTLSPKVFESTFSAIYADDPEQFDRFARIHSIYQQPSELQDVNVKQDQLIQGLLYDGIDNSSYHQSIRLGEILRHNSQQTHIDSIYMSSIMYFICKLYANQGAIQKEKDKYGQYNWIEETQKINKDFVKHTIGQILNVINDLNVFKLKLQIKINLAESLVFKDRNHIVNSYELLQRMLVSCNLILQSLGSFIRESYPTMIPAYNSELLVQDLQGAKSGVLSTFTKLITEDINSDSLYLIMMSRYFYDKLLLKSPEIMYEMMQQQLVGKFIASDLMIMENMTWYLQTLQKTNVQSIFNINRYITDELDNEVNRILSMNQNALYTKQPPQLYQYNLLNIMMNPYLMCHYEPDVQGIQEIMESTIQDGGLSSVSQMNVQQNKATISQTFLYQKELYISQDILKVITYQQLLTQSTNQLLSRNEDLLYQISRFISGENTIQTATSDIYYQNMCDLGIIPLNISIIKKDVPLTNIIINSKLFQLSFKKYIQQQSENHQQFKLTDNKFVDLISDHDSYQLLIYPLFTYLQLSLDKIQKIKSLQNAKNILMKYDQFVMDQWFYSQFIMLMLLRYQMGSHQGVDDVKMMNRGLEFIGNLANPTDIIQQRRPAFM